MTTPYSASDKAGLRRGSSVSRERGHFGPTLAQRHVSVPVLAPREVISATFGTHTAIVHSRLLGAKPMICDLGPEQSA